MEIWKNVNKEKCSKNGNLKIGNLKDGNFTKYS